MSDQDFRIRVHKLLLKPNTYLFDWGTNMDANRVILERLENRIKKHPLIWKLFFMI